MVKSNTVNLYICHSCHYRLQKNDLFNRYRDGIYCADCFVDFLHKVDLSSIDTNLITVEGTLYPPKSPLVTEKFSLD